MTNLFKILFALSLFSIALLSCSDDDSSSSDTVDQLNGTSWMLAYSRTTDCSDDFFNEAFTCNTGCPTITWEDNELIQADATDTITVNYSKVDENTIEICLIECSEGNVEIDGDKLILSSGPDEDGCNYYSEYRKL